MPNRCCAHSDFPHGGKRKREWWREMYFVDAVLATLPTIFRNVTSVHPACHDRIESQIFAQGATRISLATVVTTVVDRSPFTFFFFFFTFKRGHKCAESENGRVNFHQ